MPALDKPAAIGKRLRLSHIFSRDAADFYVEPKWVNERLFEVEDFGRDRILLDPCCGTGRIATAARTFGYTVKACDIVDRGFPATRVEDFLKRKSLAAGSVVGNPPFNLVEMFAHHALLDLHATKVALVFPVARLNAARWLQELPLRRVWLLTPRPSMPPGHVIARGEKAGGGKVDFAWLVFEHGYAGSAELAWLHRDGKTSCSQKR